jgi:hypothetical protein
MQYGPLVICVDYPTQLRDRNLSIVVFIVSRWDNKVRHVSVVERPALAQWYTEKKNQFDPDTHYYLISTTSVVGEIIALLPDKTSEYKPDVGSVN